MTVLMTEIKVVNPKELDHFEESVLSKTTELLKDFTLVALLLR